MIKKLRYIIITVMFLACSFLFGFKTLYKNYRPLVSSTLDTIKKEENSSFASKSIHTFESIISNANKVYNTSLSGKRYFIEAYGTTQLLIDKRFIEDPAVGIMLKDNQNMLHFAGYITDTRVEANMTKEINEYMNSINVPFLFVSALSKDIENLTTYKNGLDIYTNSNENKKLFFDTLNNTDVKYLDLNESKDLQDTEKAQLFFKTDHHWKTEAAFWANKKILEYLNENYFNNEIDTTITTNVNSFNKITLENSFLGSLGKRMGLIYSGIDDYSYMVPRFETNYSIYTGFNGNPVANGSFEEVIVDKTLSNPDMPMDTNRYGTYFGMDRDFETVINNTCDNDYKICIIKDSYCLPVAAFLSLNFKEVTMIDLRLAKNNSVKEFIKNGDYDLVIMHYGLGSMASESMFTLN